jgi:hypothetical protein
MQTNRVICTDCRRTLNGAAYPEFILFSVRLVLRCTPLLGVQASVESAQKCSSREEEILIQIPLRWVVALTLYGQFQMGRLNALFSVASRAMWCCSYAPSLDVSLWSVDV